MHVPSGRRLNKLWKDPPFSMGKSTLSTGPFSMLQTVILPEGKYPCIDGPLTKQIEIKRLSIAKL